MAVGRIAGKNLILQNRIVMKVLEGRKQHFLCGVRINRIDAVSEALLLIQHVRRKHPDAGIRAGILSIRLGREEHGNQRRFGPVKHPGRKTVVLHQGNPAGVVVLFGRILQNLLSADIEIIRDEALNA